MSGTPHGTKDDPWQLTTPPGTSTFQMWIDEDADPPALICQVGRTQLRYDRRAVDDADRRDLRWEVLLHAPGQCLLRIRTGCDSRENEHEIEFAHAVSTSNRRARATA